MRFLAILGKGGFSLWAERERLEKARWRRLRDNGGLEPVTGSADSVGLFGSYSAPVLLNGTEHGFPHTSGCGMIWKWTNVRLSDEGLRCPPPRAS
jgi:hypothetical protein